MLPAGSGLQRGGDHRLGRLVGRAASLGGQHNPATRHIQRYVKSDNYCCKAKVGLLLRGGNHYTIVKG